MSRDWDKLHRQERANKEPLWWQRTDYSAYSLPKHRPARTKSHRHHPQRPRLILLVMDGEKLVGTAAYLKTRKRWTCTSTSAKLAFLRKAKPGHSKVLLLKRNYSWSWHPITNFHPKNIALAMAMRARLETPPAIHPVTVPDQQQCEVAFTLQPPCLDTSTHTASATTGKCSSPTVATAVCSAARSHLYGNRADHPNPGSTSCGSLSVRDKISSGMTAG